MHRKCVWGGGRGGEREGVVSGFLRPGTFGPPHTVIPNVILTWHVHGKQNLHLKNPLTTTTTLAGENRQTIRC